MILDDDLVILDVNLDSLVDDLDSFWSKMSYSFSLDRWLQTSFLWQIISEYKIN